MRSVVALLVLATCAFGCGNKTPDEQQPVDAGDTGVVADAGDADTGPKGIPPLAPVTEPVPVAIDRFLVGRLPTTATTDTVRAAIEAGTFVLPTDGATSDGVKWKAIAPGAKGELGTASSGQILYGAAQLDLATGTRVFGRIDAALSVYTNAVIQPADIYASGSIRVPMVVHEGSNLVVVRGIGGRGQVQAQLYSTPDELVMNLDDRTVPDLVVGDASEQWIGVPVLNLTGNAAYDVSAKVEDNESFVATTVTYPSLAAGSVTKLAFDLKPKAAFTTPKQKIKVALRIESMSLDWSYRREIELDTVDGVAAYRRTFRSPTDGSAQYYGVLAPKDVDKTKSYALVLSLHGASVQAIGQAGAYSARDWNYLIAPTNRRPYGFDWEEWGTLDALEVLEHATGSFKIAPDQVYLTGHSMGGHGTWHVGILFPGRFATLGPSAGWISFETYAGVTRATGALGRAQAASNTLDYVTNLAKRGAYIIHGDADDNVPVTEARTMVDVLKPITSDVIYHEEPGAGHWWDGTAAPGADCVDWQPLFDFMKSHKLDPSETTFKFKTPSPWVSNKHSYVTIVSEADAYLDCALDSSQTGDTVTLTTTNVRSMTLAGGALLAKGAKKVVVDGKSYDVTDGPIAIGPTSGKTTLVHGPLNEVFHRPFCFVFQDDASGLANAYQRYASFLISSWAVTGNGLACALPISRVTPQIRKDYNLVYLGMAKSSLAAAPKELSWDSAITVGATKYDGSALAMVFPESGRLSALLATSPGSETFLFRFMPFSSRGGVPDWFVWSTGGAKASGFFDPEWKYQEGR